jgi:hypothetical protein
MYLYRGGHYFIDLRPDPTYIDNQPIDATGDPIQENFSTESETPIIKNIGGLKTLLLPKAQYKITGRVVSKNHYYMDWLSKLSPVDLALAWGPFSTNKFDNGLSFYHSDRYYNFKYTSTFTGDPATIATHSANEHLIPANSHIKDAIKSIRVGEIVELEGLLVNINWMDEKGEPNSLTTSLTRYDTGAGACEIIYVTKVKIKNNIFE